MVTFERTQREAYLVVAVAAAAAAEKNSVVCNLLSCCQLTRSWLCLYQSVLHVIFII